MNFFKKNMLIGRRQNNGQKNERKNMEEKTLLEIYKRMNKIINNRIKLKNNKVVKGRKTIE